MCTSPKSPSSDTHLRLAATDAAIDPTIVERWSPRSFSPEPIPPGLVQSMFEAARWAPSAMNLQPWAFVYADEEPDLQRARSILMDFNRRWADRAPLLIFAFARKQGSKPGQINRSAAFDAGAAWMALAMEAHRLGLHTHAMGGIHVDRAHAVLNVPPDEFEALCAIAVGRRGPLDALPEDLRAREVPSMRKPVSEFAFRGTYPVE